MSKLRIPASIALAALAIGAAPARADEPVLLARADRVSVAAGRTVIFDALANDERVGETAPAVVSTTTPGHGAVTVRPDGTLSYASQTGYQGYDTFDYTIRAAGGSAESTATVSVLVMPLNTPPKAGDDEITVAQKGAAQSIAVLGNDSDADGDSLSIVEVSRPTNGAVATVSGGAIQLSGFAGLTSFTYTVSDGRGGLASATVLVR